MDCVFCAITEGRLPAHLIHQDEHFLVLLDIHPLRPGHLLIVSRAHAPYLSELPVAARDRLLILADGLCRVQRAAGFGGRGINLLLNDGPDANQHVPHLHLHLIPRRSGDVPALLWRILTRFLPLPRTRLDERLAREANLMREALREVFGRV